MVASVTACRPLLFLPHQNSSSTCSSSSSSSSTPSSLHRRKGFRLFASPPSAAFKGGDGAPRPLREMVADWVSKNDGFVRILPIYVGGFSLIAVLLNRAISGISPVADASSSQSRADILTLSLAVTNLLTGLVWLSIQPKSISAVVPSGVYCKQINSDIAHPAALELLWAWESLSATTCCKSLIVVYGNKCLMQIGVAAESSTGGGVAVDVDIDNLKEGSLYKSTIENGKQSYLANLSLYPGKSELPFLPNNTQAVILQPIGDRGIAIIGGDTVRGFSNLDQAWITLIAEKLDSTLSKL